jgi:ATP-dependent DNA helicase RecG
MPAFRGIARAANGWLDAPNEAALASLVAKARDASEHVPSGRMDDWQRLLGGFERTEPADRRRARVEALARACALFSRPVRVIEPLRWGDSTDRVAGIGPSTRQALAEAGIATVSDLVWLLPNAWDDLRAPLSVAEATKLAEADGRTPRIAVQGVVRSASVVPMKGRRAVRVVISTADAPKPTLHAWWFFQAHGVLALAKPASSVLLVGLAIGAAPHPTKMAHPDLLLDEPEARVVKPRYPRVGVPEVTVRKAIGAALERLHALPDPVPEGIVARESMGATSGLLRAAHAMSADNPATADVLALRERLAWVEAFAHVRARLAAERTQGEGIAIPTDRATHARFVAELGFPLTGAQKRAIAAVLADLATSTPMRRLVLGDVGSGKTAVALAAAAQCKCAGIQVAILAPTSILAEQTLDAAAPLARATGASIALITGDVPAPRRARSVRGLARGEIDIVIGTHALLSDDVVFARLGLVIVDEQHRLGVGQRLALVKKGAPRPHLLTLSATPIPRTLALALRGELATSIIDQRPLGRLPVATEVRPRDDIDAVVEELRACVAERGERAFFVVPRIEDDEDGEGVEARANDLAERLAPIKVVVVHGGLRGETKRAAMQAFRRGEAQILVGTTVVEVGVDVPEATLLVVDGAERFGLAQLHQLRGRVGRSHRPSRCILLHGDDVTDVARRRLDAIANTHDGAEVARLDLELRGAGDLGGTRQSGDVEEFAFLDHASPPAWLARIEDDARTILAADPELAQHPALALAARRFDHLLAVRREAG